MLIICAAIEIARRGHSTTALSMGLIYSPGGRGIFFVVSVAHLLISAPYNQVHSSGAVPLDLSISCSGTNVTTTIVCPPPNSSIKECENTGI